MAKLFHIVSTSFYIKYYFLSDYMMISEVSYIFFSVLFLWLILSYILIQNAYSIIN